MAASGGSPATRPCPIPRQLLNQAARDCMEHGACAGRTVPGVLACWGGVRMVSAAACPPQHPQGPHPGSGPKGGRQAQALLACAADPDLSQHLAPANMYSKHNTPPFMLPPTSQQRVQSPGAWRPSPRPTSPHPGPGRPPRPGHSHRGAPSPLLRPQSRCTTFSCRTLLPHLPLPSASSRPQSLMLEVKPHPPRPAWASKMLRAP